VRDRVTPGDLAGWWRWQLTTQAYGLRIMADSDRPQDVGRQHRRKASPGAATQALLDRYQDAMRDELGYLLDSLTPQPGLAGTTMRAALADRSKTWDLAIKIARALGGEIDPGPLAGDVPDPLGEPTMPPRRRGRVDYGGA
jgi:hypothetical protein